MSLLHPLKVNKGFSILLHRSFFVSKHRTANPRVSVPLISCFEGLSRTKVETTSSLTSCAKVNFTLKAPFGINSFYFLKQNQSCFYLLKPDKRIQIHSVLFGLGSEERVYPSWVHTAIYFLRIFYIREKKGDVEERDNYVKSEAVLY